MARPAPGTVEEAAAGEPPAAESPLLPLGSEQREKREEGAIVPGTDGLAVGGE